MSGGIGRRIGMGRAIIIIGGGVVSGFRFMLLPLATVLPRVLISMTPEPVCLLSL